MNLGLESLHTEEPTMSFEELMVDICELQNDLMNEQELINGFENCISLLESIHQHGITDTIKDVIGDQIAYTSQEELVAGLEGVLGKVLDKAFANISPFNPNTRELDTNPKDAIVRLRKLISACINELRKLRGTDNVTSTAVVGRIYFACNHLEELIRRSNINAAANDKNAYTAEKIDDTGKQRGVDAYRCQQILEDVDTALERTSKWLGSKDMRDAVNKFKSGETKLTTKGESNLGRLVIEAKKQFRVIAQNVMALYAGLKKHRIRKNANDVKNTEVI
jgi:hypothetical protein